MVGVIQRNTSENRLQLKTKILRMTILVTLKTEKNIPKAPENLKLKTLKYHLQRPQMKNFKKHVMVKI